MAVSAARYTLLALLFSLLWASGFVAIKIALRDCPPLLLMASRFLVGGAVLLLIARLRGSALPATWRTRRAIAILGVLNNAFYLGVTALLLVRLSAGTGAVLASTNPLMLAVAAPWFLDERLTVPKALGLVVSYAGVAWVMWRRVGAQDSASDMLIWLCCSGFLVTATILFKRWRLGADLLVINGGQLLAAGIVLTLPALLFESLGAVHLSLPLLAAQAYLITVISTAAMMLWLWLLRHGDATRAGAWFFLNPVLGLFMAAVVLGEPLHAQDFLGSLLVGAGIYMVQRG
jgi:drug/metabolite transporter (DMT)-like permease